MTLPTSEAMAFDQGLVDRRFGRPRISPFYEVKRIVDGRSVDVTDRLDACWYAGYDGEKMPELEPQGT